jgi:hypothetical protein
MATSSQTSQQAIMAIEHPAIAAITRYRDALAAVNSFVSVWSIATVLELMTVDPRESRVEVSGAQSS